VTKCAAYAPELCCFWEVEVDNIVDPADIPAVVVDADVAVPRSSSTNNRKTGDDAALEALAVAVSLGE
jgi:hypothetical protein